jgi:phosphoglycerol transferase MdoB-like AlkP superfamily enzyme
MKKWIASRNIFVVLVYRIFLIMILFSLFRVGFFFFNIKMFPGVTLVQFINILRGGLLFDISAVVYINLLFIFLHIVPFEFRYNDVYQKVLKFIFFLTNGLALAMNGMDFVYYKFVDKRASADIFKTFEHEANMGKLFFRFLLDYWPTTLLTLIAWFSMVYFYNRVSAKRPSPVYNSTYRVLNFIMIPLITVLIIGAARGGFSVYSKPISISSAYRYVETPRDAAIVLNTPFSFFRTLDKKEIINYKFFNEEKLNKLYFPHHYSKNTKPFSNENVVIIILESFAREYIGALNRELDGGAYKGYTPFIDSLINVSLTFDVSIANGKKSIDAMPSILASVPSLETPYIISKYSTNEINGLPALLKRKGYYSAFFHGAPNGSMKFDSFSKVAGFDDYFGLNQYPVKEDFDGMWGVWDEPFLKYFGEKMNGFKQPFIASVFSLSSHHPFEVPVQYKGKFKKGPAPIVEVVGYTDFALRKLFNQISTSSWFNNTLFVITSDHTNESIHPEFQNDFGSYCVPIIFYKPGSDLKGVKKRVAQQIDIMPTILSYLNYDEEYIAFGNNLLDDASESFAFNTNGSNYHLYMKDHILEMVDNKTVGLYNYKNDVFLKDNLLRTNPELELRLEEKLKAIIQTYNSRLIDNRMVVRNKD